jgi:NAD(P)-dependent dehydrogenase (short-subunit alcohol dehydrogenase family)
MTKINFQGRVALVTGAGGGLGREYALELAQRGARVVVNDLGVNSAGEKASSAMADKVVEEIRAAGGEAVANYDSVATRAGGSAIVQTALDSWGRLDSVIINAGLLRTNPFDEQTDEQIALMVNSHLMQGFYVGQPAYRAMKAQGYGRFVFMGSAVGMFGDGWKSSYGAGKAGLFAISNNIANDGARHGIKSNVVLPTAQSRMSEQIDEKFIEDLPAIANLAAALDLSQIHGQFLPIYNAPLTIYLASEACQETHGVFSSVAGRYARCSVGVGRGWRKQDGALASVDEVAAHWEAIADDHMIGRPYSVFDEFRILIDDMSPSRTEK